MWKLDDTPAQQCSAGAAATQPFVKAWAVFGAIMAISIFGRVYVGVIGVISLRKILNGTYKFLKACTINNHKIPRV